MEQTVSYLLMLQKLLNLKQKILRFKKEDSKETIPLCLGNISKNWSIDNLKDTGLNGYVYDFSVDYDAVTVDDILYIHKYLMKKNNMI